MALSCLNTLSMRLTGHLHSFGHCVHVLVTPAGEVDDNDVIGGVLGRQPLKIGDGVGGLQGGENAFGPGEQAEPLQGLGVRHRHVFGPPWRP